MQGKPRHKWLARSDRNERVNFSSKKRINRSKKLCFLSLCSRQIKTGTIIFENFVAVSDCLPCESCSRIIFFSVLFNPPKKYYTNCNFNCSRFPFFISFIFNSVLYSMYIVYSCIAWFWWLPTGKRTTFNKPSHRLSIQFTYLHNLMITYSVCITNFLL